jgi:PAS domain S-box-containing protein
MSASPSDEGELEALRRELARLRDESEAIRRRADRYQALFEALPVSVQVVDRAGVIVEVNPFHLEHMGKGRTTQTDYQGQRIFERTSVVASGLSEQYARTLEAQPFEANEVLFPALSGGGQGYFNVRGVCLREADKNVGALFISEDVTALKRAKDELIRHQATLEQLVDARTASLRAALDKVKMLSGLLPICAGCKKIRDPKGSWNQLEAYIASHSEAQFSHGLCPDCIEQLYPERDPGEG